MVSLLQKYLIFFPAVFLPVLGASSLRPGVSGRFSMFLAGSQSLLSPPELPLADFS